MDWQTELTRVLRYTINDLDPDTPIYSDERLQEQILVAATYVLAEIDFPTKYQVVISSGTLTPDPTTTSPIDDAFITLTTLKAAAQIEYGEYRAAMGGIVKVSDGTSSYDGTAKVLAYKLAFANGMAQMYKDFRKEYKFGTYIPGKLIATPFSSPNIVLAPWFYSFRDRFH